MSPLVGAFPATLPVVRELRSTAEGRAWLAALPTLVLRLAAEWELRLGRPFHGGSSSWVAAVTRTGGRPAVLKVAWPHREALGEPAGLRAWDGDGAVRLLRAAPQHYALLVERARPGTPLDRADLPPEEGLGIAAALLRRLWSAPPPAGAALERVSDVCAERGALARHRWRRLAPPYDRGLVETGADLLTSLPSTATREVVVHGNLGPSTILAAQRQPWLAIDARPMVGDPGYDPGPLVLRLGRPFADPDPAAALRTRFRLVADAVGEPAERLLAWSVARTVESALWSAARGEVTAGSAAMAEAATLARLAGL